MNKTYILFVTFIICLCTTFNCYSNSEDIDETDKIIQFQDSVIKNNDIGSHVYGGFYDDLCATIRGLSIRGAVAWLRDCEKNSRPVVAIDGDTPTFTISVPETNDKEYFKRDVEEQKQYINRYPFEYYFPDSKKLLNKFLSENKIVIRYKCGLPEFKTLTVQLKVYIPGSEIVHIFTYRYKLYFKTDESDKYISLEDAISDISEEEISSLYDTQYFLDEIEYKEWTREQDNENDFWGPL